MLALVMPGITEWIVIAALISLLFGMEWIYAIFSKTPFEWIAIGFSKLRDAIPALRKALKDLDDSLFR